MFSSQNINLQVYPHAFVRIDKKRDKKNNQGD